MPAYQSTYTAAPASGYAGMIADTEYKTVFSAEVQTAAVAFGLAVGKGSAANTAKLGGTGYFGVAVADKANLNLSAAGYAIGDIGGFITKGAVWVTASVTVAITDTVYFVPATGVITNVSTSNVAIPNARFATAATSGNLVLLVLA